MPKYYAHTDLTLHGRFTDDGNYYRLFVLLNGVELPVQTLSVADYRESFEEAASSGKSEAQPQQSQ